jgi:hypothetical protein
MNLYFAGMECTYCHEAVMDYTGPAFSCSILESFWLFKYKQHAWDKLHARYVRMKESGKVKKIIIDSGAHSIIYAYTGAKNTKHLLSQIKGVDNFINNYLEFVEKFKDVVDAFFELDTSPFTFTYAEQLKIRDRFFKAVNTPEQFLPVYHLRYDKDLKKCLEDHYREYKYIGIAGREGDVLWDKSRFESYFEILKNFACKIHGLAVTSWDKMKQFPFYSVDSTTYIHNVKLRQLQTINLKDGTMQMYYLGDRENTIALRGFNKVIIDKVMEHVDYLIKKYDLKTTRDILALGKDSAPTKGFDSYLHNIAIYNICEFLEMTEYVNIHKTEFENKGGKKQTELFDLLGG